MSVRLYDIQMLIATTLQASPTFEAACIDKFASAFNFYVDPSLSDNDEVIPYCSVHKFQKIEEAGKDDAWVVQCVFAVQPGSVPTVVSGIRVYPAQADLEYLSDLACAEVKGALKCQLFDDESLYIENVNTLFTEVGEAQLDIQCITTITLARVKLF